MVGNQEVKVKPGQFIYGRQKAAKETGLPERKIRTCLDQLIKLRNLAIQTTNKYTLITIVNWNDYQGDSLKSSGKESKKTDIDNNSKDISSRESKFKTEVMAFTDKYPMPMLFTEGDADSVQDRRSFFGYWTERNSGGKSMAFEKQKTFDIARRLATWANNQKDFSSKPSSGRATYGGHESERIGDVYLGPAPDGVE